MSFGPFADEDLADPDQFVPYDRLLQLWDSLVARFPDRPLGMLYGDQLPLTVTGVVGQVCANAPTLRAALQAQIRFNRLLDPRLAVGHEAQPPLHRITFAYGMTNPCIPEILEMLVTTTVRFARLLAGEPNMGPARVCFAHGQRHPDTAYASRTLCEAVFDAGWTGIEFSPEFLNAPVLKAQPDAQKYLARHAELLLAERAPRAPSTLAEQVRHRVADMLANGSPTAEAVAAALGMSERTMQRRLHAEHTSFSDAVDDVRRQGALRLLAQPHVTIQETAFVLGYAEPRAFHRAFRRWTGTTPGQFRRAMAHGVPSLAPPVPPKDHTSE